MKELEQDFPIEEVSRLAEQESWRKEINRPIYHIHKWWAKRLGSVFRALTLSALSEPGTRIWDEFYRVQDLRGKVVLDPFMGSGTTIGEALKLGAKAIGCDVNPVSTFLVKQALTPVSEATLRRAFCELESSVASQIQHFYKTRDPNSGELIPVMYFFWVKVVTTPSGEVIPLLSRYVFAQDAYPKKKPSAQLLCKHCWSVFQARYDADQVECPSCGGAFNPQEGPASGQHVTDSEGRKYRIKELLPKVGPPAHRLYAVMAAGSDGRRLYLTPTEFDHSLFAEAERRLASEDFPLPTLQLRPGHNIDQAKGYGYSSWRDFFNARQLLCLGMLLKEILKIQDTAVQEQLLCLFSSTLEFNNLFCSFKGEGTGAVRHMFSNHILKPERTPLENSIWGAVSASGTFNALFESRLLKAKRYLDEPFELAFNDKGGTKKVLASAPLQVPQVNSWEEFQQSDRAAMILNGNSANLAQIPDKSVDAVVTDPPYFDYVHYSELSDFFFAWLSPVLKARYDWFDTPDCSDEGEVQDNDPRVFARQLSLVFRECARVLKDDGVLTFSFHHSRPEGWAAIYEAITSAGLAVVAAHPVHAELKAASPKSAAKDPISLDAILVCKKLSHVQQEAGPRVEQVMRSAARLCSAGLTLTAGDVFVITASQLLVELSPHRLTFEEFEALLEERRTKVSWPLGEAFSARSHQEQLPVQDEIVYT